MSESAALALVEQVEEKPLALMQRATDVAAVCRAAVEASAVDIDGGRFVEVEGWCTIAAAYGCVPSIREVVEEERGIRAVAELKRADGTVVAAAEGFCGLDEPRWSNRPMYARRGMAQTRAISRVCRTAFSFVIVLMKAGLRTTPAEEMPSYEAKTVGASPVAGAAIVEGKASATLTAVANNNPERIQATKVRFGKSKGQYLCDIEAKDLDWQLAAAKKSVDANDPKWHAQNRAWLSIVEAELTRRNGVA